MLDTDDTTTDTPDNSGTPDTSGSGDAPPADTPAPRKRAPRKTAKKAAPAASESAEVTEDAPAERPAPRKRAPRKATAKATTPSPAPAAEAQPVTEPAFEAATSDPPPAAAPAKRAPRKRATKAAAAPATETPAIETPVAESPVAETATSETPAADASSTPADTSPTEPQFAAPPAKRTPRKRAAKKATAPVAEPAEATGAQTADTQTADAQAADAESSGSETSAAEAGTPGVLFVAPQAEPAPRRRRAAKKAAGAPAPAAESTDAAPSDDTSTTTEPSSEEAAGSEADPDDVREAAIEQANGARRRRRRGRRGRGGGAKNDESGETADDDSSDDDTSDDADASAEEKSEAGDGDEGSSASSRRRRRRRRSGSGNGGDDSPNNDDPPNTVTHVRDKKAKDGKGSGGGDDDGVRGIKGSTRLEAKRQRRRDGRETTRRRPPILTEAEFLARREAVDRVMAVRQRGDRTQIAVLEDDILVEHYVTRASATSYVGNVYLGRVQNVLPSMEAAFVDIGKNRNGVLYAGEVNWDAAGLDGKSRTIEHAMKSGDSVLVQVTKDPIGHKGARLTSQVSLPGRFLVYVPGGGMTGISRRLPDTERHRLKAILKKIVPDEAGVIVRTAAEGASEEDLTRDVERLQAQWESIQKQADSAKNGASPKLLHGEPDLAVRVVRDVFNEDFGKLVVEGDDAWTTVSDYVGSVAPDLAERVSKHTGDGDLFHDLRVDEQLAKALDRKVWLPSGGSLVIDRTEAMTVVDVNTGKFVGSGGNLEQTVTRNNIEAAEEIVRQLRLRDVGGIVVIDFIDMVLESNRDLVLRRLTECLGRDRTKHQVAEVTSLGLVQMTRKRVGEGLLEAFSEPCEHCHGRGVIVHGEPVDKSSSDNSDDDDRSSGGRKRGRRGSSSKGTSEPATVEPPATDEQRQAANAAIAAIHRATATGTDGQDASDGALTTLATDLVNAAMNGAKQDDAKQQGGAAQPEPVAAQPEPVAAEPEAAESESSPAETNGTPQRRRRRAASRPAGPPVNV